MNGVNVAWPSIGLWTNRWKLCFYSPGSDSFKPKFGGTLISDQLSGKRLGFLGPNGTFTEEALVRLPVETEFTAVPLPSIADVISAVQAGDVDEGIVPVENLIEGTVNATTDMLVFRVDLRIQQEIVLPVDHNLLVRPGTDLRDIKAVYSNPHATAQCSEYLGEFLPGVAKLATNSTADAARLVASEIPEGAAIATRLAAEIYGLESVGEQIQDVKENVTRFIVLGKGDTEPTGQDKTSIVCFIHEDRPGSLLEILKIFAAQGINLTKLESRPTKTRLGEYCFLIDLEGHRTDEHVAEAFRLLDEFLPVVKVLGSYPRWKDVD